MIKSSLQIYQGELFKRRGRRRSILPTKPLKKMKETQLIRQILDYCEYNHLLFVRHQSGMVKTWNGGVVKMGKAGWADILGCHKGRFVAVETKVGKNKQTPQQLEFQRRVTDCGGVYWVIRDIDEFITNLKTL